MAWQPARDHVIQTLGAVAADGQSASFNVACTKLYVKCQITAIGAGESVQFFLEGQDPGSSQWYPLAQGDVLAAAGTSVVALDFPPSDALRVRWDVTTADDITFGVRAVEVGGG